MKVKVLLTISSVGWIDKKYGLFDWSSRDEDIPRMTQGAGKLIVMGFENARQTVLGRIECV